MNGLPRTPPQWLDAPATGAERADSIRLANAIEALDEIAAVRRTDAFRVLASRYRDDLLQMKREDEQCTKGATR